MFIITIDIRQKIIKIFSIEKKKIVYIISDNGGVAEWLNAPVLKTDVGESLPWVRIPPPPPLLKSPLEILRLKLHHFN